MILTGSSERLEYDSNIQKILGLLHLAPSIQTEILTADPNALSEIPEYKLRDLSAESDWNRQTILWQELKHARA